MAETLAAAGRDACLAESYGLVDFLRSTWDGQISGHNRSGHAGSGERLHAGAVARETAAWARDRIGDRVTFVADGGDALTWGLAYMYAEGPGRLLSTTTALGTLGVGLPFALGAKAARQGLPVICIVSNNCGWGDVAHEQDMWFGEGRRVASELTDARYDLMAAAFGAR